jgi:hypothetical protein
MIILVLYDEDQDGLHTYKFDKLADLNLNLLTEPDDNGLSWKLFGTWAIFDTDQAQRCTELKLGVFSEPIWQYGGVKLEQIAKGGKEDGDRDPFEG